MADRIVDLVGDGGSGIAAEIRRRICYCEYVYTGKIFGIFRLL
jgi:hypothetical protein